MGYDIYSADYSKMQIDKLIKELDELDKSLTKDVMPVVMKKIGNELLKEEKRILGFSKYKKFANWLTVMTEKNYGKWTVRAGYPSKIIEEHREIIIIEYGRPGNPTKTIDKKGRKIGVVQPYPHIRPAIRLKQEQIYNLAETELIKELEKIWEKN